MGELRTKIDAVINKYVVENQNRKAKISKATSEILKDISDLPFSAHFARFQENSQSHSLVIVYGLKAADLKFAKDDSIITLFVAAAVKDTNRLPTAVQQDTLNLSSASFDGAGEFVGVVQYEILAGHYLVALDLNNPGRRQRGLKDFSITTGSYPTGSLHLSSVIFAKKVMPVDSVTNQHAFTRHHLAITPYPFPTLEREARMFVYFEIYDLQRAAGETFYEGEYEVNALAKKGFASLLASLNPFGKAGGSISVSDTRRGNAAVEPAYLQLDFSQLGRGKYDLIVRVTDKLANITKESKLEFELE